MLRFYVTLMLRCVVGLVVFNLAARALGHAQPPNPALRGFAEGCEGKPQPCWYGIVPGVTTGREAETRLLKQALSCVEAKSYLRPYARRCCRNPRGLDCLMLIFDSRCEVAGCDAVEVYYLEIEPSASLRLGDLFVQLGAPRFVEFTSGPYGYLLRWRDYYAVFVASPSFYQTSAWIIASAYAYDLPNSPYRGLMPIWRYCQFEPRYWDCARVRG